MEDVVIVSTVKTTIVSFKYLLKNASIVEFGIVAVKAIINRISFTSINLNKMILDSILYAESVQSVAKHIATSLISIIPIKTPILSVGKIYDFGISAMISGYLTLRVSISF